MPFQHKYCGQSEPQFLSFELELLSLSAPTLQFLMHVVLQLVEGNRCYLHISNVQGERGTLTIYDF